MSDRKYGEASLKAREYFASKVRNQLNKNVSDYGLRFLKLTSMIPNWETYLTPKQRESALRYIKCLNAYEVDYQLKLRLGTTHQRLFGNKSSKGALGRLEEVYKMLEKNGAFDKKEEEVKSAPKKSRLSPKTLNDIRELIYLLVNIPNYDKYLTKSQAKKAYHFLRLKNLSAAAKYCGVSQKTFKQVLLNDILSKLRKVNSEKTINSWEEI